MSHLRAGSLTPLKRSSTPSTWISFGASRCRVRLERVEIGAEQLDLDGLRRAGKIVDDVGEDLYELDVQPRNSGLDDLRAHVVDHLVARAVAIGLALETARQMSPRILFRREQAELRARPARRAATSGVAASMRSAMSDLPVGLVERRSARSEVVEDERAFVDLGKKAGADEPVCDETERRAARSRRRSRARA